MGGRAFAEIAQCACEASLTHSASRRLWSGTAQSCVSQLEHGSKVDFLCGGYRLNEPPFSRRILP